MSFAKEFSRNVRAVQEEIAYYRTFAALHGMAEPLALLEAMHDRWQERNERYVGRGRAITEPFDWQEDREQRGAAKEIMNKIIKVAKEADAAKEAAMARMQNATWLSSDDHAAPPTSDDQDPDAQR